VYLVSAGGEVFKGAFGKHCDLGTTGETRAEAASRALVFLRWGSHSVVDLATPLEVPDSGPMFRPLVFLREELFRIGDTSVSLLSLLLFACSVTATLIVARGTRVAVARLLGRRPDTPPVGTAGVRVSLDTLGVDLGALAAFGAVLSVGIGFGLQTITHNFISGIILLIERPVQKGDFVVVGDIVGTVTEIEMRATKVVSRDGVAIIVPNSEFISARVVNQSHPTSRKRVQIRVGVAYGSDTSLVRDTLIAIGLAHPKVLREPGPVVFFRNFGDSALDFDLAVWLDHPEPEPVVTSDLRFSIDRVFREKKIEIPFPQREVRLRKES
jgi:small-conductance mechanosensitive channel